ncbi:MAG: hypothetical protein K6E13_01305, partial [Lachnospiraceae bacterium]|nr:hypothetical protein [Lachnospiraceae bacterium]
MNYKIKPSLVKIILLFAATLSFSMCLSSDGEKWTRFYNVGTYYESKSSWNGAEITANSSSWTTKKLKVSSTAEYTQLELYIQGIPDGVTIYGDYYILDGEVITYCKRLELKNGKNVFAMNSADIKKVLTRYRVINGPESVTFRITSYKVIEKPAKGNWRYSLGIFILGLPIIYLLYCCFIKLMNTFVIVPQTGKSIINTYNISLELITKNIKSAENIYVDKMRIVLWVCLGIFTTIGTTDALDSASNFNTVQLIEGLLILVLSVLYFDDSYKKSGKQIVANELLAVPFLCFSILLMVSDFVKYNLASYGLFLLICVSLFGYSVNTMKNKDLVIHEIGMATEIILWLSTVFCVLFRPKVQG